MKRDVKPLLKPLVKDGSYWLQRYQHGITLAIDHGAKARRPGTFKNLADDGVRTGKARSAAPHQP